MRNQYIIHDGLIESFDTKHDSITLIDPEPEHKNRYQMDITEFFDRINGTFGRKTGILLIKKKNPS
jgi:hypothetical protein